MSHPALIPAEVWDSAVDLDADLNEAIPCEWPECHNEATTRGTSIHDHSGNACRTEHYCDACSLRAKQYVASGPRPTCIFHNQRVTVLWRPLHPVRADR